MRYRVPVVVTITADSAEQAQEMTTVFMHKVLPAYRPFSATYVAEVGDATPRCEASSETSETGILSTEEAAAFAEMADPEA